VLVGHTHFDHAVDAPAIARRHRAKAYGSESLVRLMRLHGLGELAVEVEPHRRYEIGPFVVRFVPSRHSKLLFGRKVPMDGELTCDHLDGLSPGAYRCGAVWGIRIEVAGVSLYHQGSANLDDAELRDEPVDVFLAGVAGRSVTPRYWERILPRLDPRVLVPTHYDNFFSPLGRPQDFVRRVDLAAVPGEVAAAARDTRVAALPRVDEPRLS
jgi:L-ascorbate metabolism protein UlaG (beta-lactamase superfamily)